MTNSYAAESFPLKKALYGAIVEETQQLILVIEAANEEEAGHRIDVVLPFWGVSDALGGQFCGGEELPAGC